MFDHISGMILMIRSQGRLRHEAHYPLARGSEIIVHYSVQASLYAQCCQWNLRPTHHPSTHPHTHTTQTHARADTHTDTDTHTHRHRQRHTHTHTETQTETHTHTQRHTETHTQRHTVTCNGLEWSSNSQEFLQQLDRVHRCIPKPRIVAIHSPTCLNLTCILGTFKHKVQPGRTALTESDSILQSPM